MRVLVAIVAVVGALIVAVTALFGVFWTIGAAEPLPEDSVSAARLATGRFSVGEADFSWVDGSRQTPAHGDDPGAASRTLPATVWYPEGARGPLPLLVYCHGLTSNRYGGAYLARHLASHGYVVVAADFPLSHTGAPGGPTPDDVVRQPGDVSFLIDRMLALSDTERPFRAALDEDRIGVFGLSLGAVTATLAAFHPRWRDPRLSAAVALAGIGDVFGRAFFHQAEVPFLMIAGTSDGIVDYRANALPIPERVPVGGLMTFANATHLGFDDIAASWLRPFRNPDAVGCYLGGADPHASPPNPFNGLFGGTQDGLLEVTAYPPPCVRSFPLVMRAARQHMLTMLAVRAFFDSEFAAEADVRAASADYLTRVMPEEIAEVSYAGSPLP